jgi:hypothetical protein
MVYLEGALLLDETCKLKEEWFKYCFVLASVVSSKKKRKENEFATNEYKNKLQVIVESWSTLGLQSIVFAQQVSP